MYRIVVFKSLWPISVIIVRASYPASAALLPRLWMTPEAFAAEHSTPLHKLHLLGELTVALEPALAYAIVSFLVVLAAFAAWPNLRGSWRVAE